MKNKGTIFIVGGTGFVGTEILKELLNLNYSVKLLARNTHKIEPANNLEIIEGDIFNYKHWEDRIDGSLAIINLIGIIRENKNKNITFNKLHVEATEIITDLAIKHNVKRYIHMSANSASSTEISNYFETKYIAENIVKSKDLVWTIFQPSLIFGRDDKSINMFIKNIKKIRIFPVFGNGNYKLQPVSVSDVAKAFTKSITNIDCLNCSFELGGTVVYTYNELIESISNNLRINNFLLHIPLDLAKPIIKIFERFDSFPITTDQLNMLLSDNTCDENKIFDILNIEQQSFDNYVKNISKHI